MADDTGLPPNPQAAAEEVQRRNAETARQLEDQGRETYDTATVHGDTGHALDDLARQASGQEGGEDGRQDEGGSDEGATSGATDGDQDGSDGGQPGAGDDTSGAGEGADGTGEGDLVQKKEGEGDDGDRAADGGDGSDSGNADGADGAGDSGADPVDGDKGSDPVDDVQLPDTATPKSAEAFQKVKDIARQQVAEAQQKLVDLQRKNDELKRKVDEGLTPEAKQELEQLREFRTKLDIEVDPQFQQYNEKIASASEFVYAQLKKAGLGEEVVDKIKEFGGPHKVNMDKILEKVDDRQVERLVNSKIADIEQFDFDKGQAIEKAKSNVQEYLQERAQQIEQGSVQHRQATRQILDSNILSNMNFLKEPKPLKDDATEDEKKLYGAQKEFVKAAKGHVDKMLSDDSPEMRAIMAGGVVKMLHLNTVVNAQKAIIDGKDETIESLTKERDDAVALAERLKKGSVNHRRRSNAPETGTQVPAPSYDPNQPTEHALDQLARQVSQHRNAGVS